tara:strand:- start:339 stop:767 length:429 start_codon:yes stop_codon:yes gene_type:complete
MLHLKIKKVITSKGISATKNRVSVLKSFFQFNKAITLSDIRLRNQKMDRVTLFRILNIFEEKKIIHKIVLNNGSILYALCNDDCRSNQGDHVDDHIHFSCNKCEEVICLDIPNFPTISVPNFSFYNLNINASGLCASCNELN